MDGLDLRALEIFRAVALEGSVSKAAEKLNRVQSNISTRLKQLERHLGKDLFLRQNRRLTMTPDGEVLLTYADRLLQLSKEASEAVNGGRPKGALRIGAMESTAAARLPAILSRYHARFPDVRIDVTTDTAGGLLSRLQDREIDVAFAAEPISFERIATVPVFQEKLVLIAPQSYPPIGNAREMSGRTVIAFELGCSYRRYLEEWLLGQGIVPGAILSVGSYLAMFACVSAGTGFAVAPQSVLDIVATKGRFRRHPLSGKLSKIKTLLAWRADYRSVNFDALREMLPAA